MHVVKLEIYMRKKELEKRDDFKKNPETEQYRREKREKEKEIQIFFKKDS